jgi:hypothetical protein
MHTSSLGPTATESQLQISKITMMIGFDEDVHTCSPESSEERFDFRLWLFANLANDVVLLQTMLIAFDQYIEADTSVLCDCRAAGWSSSLVLPTGNEDAVFQKARRLDSEYARKYFSCIQIECQVKHHLNAAALRFPWVVHIVHPLTLPFKPPYQVMMRHLL